MGLAVSVADLAFFLEEEDLEPDEIQEQHDIYNLLSQFLVDNGYPEHVEPVVVPDIPSRGELDGFPYPWLHFLRRAYVYTLSNEPLRPHTGERATDDPLLRAWYDRGSLSSHLVDHSDSVGFYVPIDFLRPIVADREGLVPGDIVGSSYGLFRELITVAPMIAIELNEDLLSNDEASSLMEDDHPFAIERMVWFSLFENAKNSIELGAALRFG